jgi:hypothetical protein
MNRPTVAVAAAAAAVLHVLAGCSAGPSTSEGPDEAEAAAHEVLRERLQAMAAQDWDHVYDLTSPSTRPADRSSWVERRSEREGGFIDRCVGEASGRPEVELATIDRFDDAMHVEAIVWTNDDQGTVCHWRVVEEDTGWRVEEHIDPQPRP